MEFTALSILSVGVFRNWKNGFKANRIIIWYLLVLFCFELLNTVIAENNLFLLGMSPFVNFAFFAMLQRKYFRFAFKSPIQGLVVLLIPALLLFPFSLVVNEFQGYSSIFFGSLILLLIVYSFYQVAAGKLISEKRKMRFLYAAMAFFTLNVFLSISVNYLINASFVLVVGFWILRFIFLQWYYLSLVQLNQSPK